MHVHGTTLCAVGTDTAAWRLVVLLRVSDRGHHAVSGVSWVGIWLRPLAVVVVV
jgi:hypothetical protein